MGDTGSLAVFIRGHLPDFAEAKPRQPFWGEGSHRSGWDLSVNPRVESPPCSYLQSRAKFASELPTLQVVGTGIVLVCFTGLHTAYSLLS